MFNLLQDSCLDGTTGAVRGVMEEIVAIARACGIDSGEFPDSSVDDALNVTLKCSPRAQREAKTRGEDVVTNLSPSFKPSILIDLENQRPMEFVPILDSLYTRARQHNIPTPRLDFICASLRPIQQAFVDRAKSTQ